MPRGLVFDQHDVGIEQVLLLTHRALERGIFKPLAQQTQQINFFAADTPSRADAKIAELGRLVGDVPALHDAVEAVRPFVFTIALEPFCLDQAATQGRWRLLILAGKVVLANRATDVLQNQERLARRMQGLTWTAGEASWSPDRLDRVHLVGFGDRWEAHNLPWLLAEHVADEVVLVQPLHDDDDAATAFVIEPAVESVEVPLVGGVAPRIGERLLRFGGVVDQNEIGTAPRSAPRRSKWPADSPDK